MKKIIILCNTYFQILIAIQLRLKEYTNDRVFLLVSDHSKDSLFVANKLKQCSLFSEVIYINTQRKYIDKDRGIILRIKNLYSMLFGDDLLSKKITCNVDEFLFYNLDLYTRSLFATLIRSNVNLKCKRFEEGVISYNFPLIQHNIRAVLPLLSDFIRKFFLKQKCLLDLLSDFYCFSPDLYNGSMIVHQIPKIKCCEIRPILKMIFDIDDSIYKYKYIFFTSVYDFESKKPIGEFYVLEKIRKIVGNDNLLVKVHPRDKRNIYKQSGYNIDVNSNICWEAIMICANIKDSILISVNSSCLLTSNIIKNNTCSSVFVYNLCNYKNDTYAELSVKRIQNIINSCNGVNAFSGERILSISSVNDLLLI